MHAKHIKAVIIAISFAFIIAAQPFTAMARDTIPVMGEDPDDAVKGRIYIDLIREEGCDYPVEADIAPAFEDGNIHEYHLGDGEGIYSVSDDIMIGEYNCVPTMDTEKDDEIPSDIQVIYSGEEREVTADTPVYFVIVEGSSSFIEQYGALLSNYVDSDGRPLKASEITQQEAAGYFDNAVSRQKEYDDEKDDPYYEEYSYAGGTGTGNGSTNENALEGSTDIQAEESPDPVEDSRDKNGNHTARNIATVAVCVGILAALRIIVKKRR